MYGSNIAIITPAIPDFTEEDSPLVDGSEGVLDLTTLSATGGAKRVHLQLPRYDAAGVAFEDELQVYVNLNTDTTPDPAAEAAGYILEPGMVLALDLNPYGGTATKLAYYVNRQGTPAGDLVWGVSLKLTLLY